MFFDPQAALSHSGGWKLELILKVSERCNLACDYCYFFFGGDDAYEKHPALISTDNVTELAAFLRRTTLASQFDFVQIDFHGGEPLLMPKKRFRDLCKSLQEALPSSTRLIFGMQTNGVLIDEEWLNIFEDFNIQVGVSLDGPEEVNDKHRVDKKGQGSHGDAVRGLMLLQEGYDEGRFPLPTVLCVASGPLSLYQLHHYFTEELGVRALDLLLPDYTHETVPTNYKDHLMKDLEAFVTAVLGAHKNGYYCRVVDQARRSLSRRFHSPRLDQFNAYKRVILTVSSGGEIGPPDVLRICDPDYFSTPLHLSEASFIDVVEQFHAPFWDAQFNLPESCSDCCWRNVCRGGDIVHRYSKDAGHRNASIYCDFLQAFYGAIAAQLLEGDLEFYELVASLGISLDEALADAA